MNNQVNEYISRQASPQKEICQHLRDLIVRTFPAATEEMKWGVPVFVGSKFYIVALKDHVNLGFSIKGLGKEELALFDGGGKTTKHVRIDSIEGIDEERITGLLRMVGERVRD